MGAVSKLFLFPFLFVEFTFSLLMYIFYTDYAASKGGLTGMMRNLSTRLAEFNISVNDVAPAMIGDTGMIPNAAAIPDVAASIPLGRLGTPEETANVVTMLLETGYMTGQSLLLTGGLK